ncbi:MAG: pentapeptide repeat-containing protein [Deltaproteobacteria bacterium]|jgi:uncharacterized protein YjbI with pentapeptide repeats|nr:pentapeptide repeat-containing protein [Deltaproteobacteria bacterium]
MLEIKRSIKPRIMLEESGETYNNLVSKDRAPDLTYQNLSDLDLRLFNLKNANLTGCYLRGANLGGVDLSEATLDGASIKNAYISGCFFPRGLAAVEIQLSVERGMRMRQSGKS